MNTSEEVTKGWTSGPKEKKFIGAPSAVVEVPQGISPIEEPKKYLDAFAKAFSSEAKSPISTIELSPDEDSFINFVFGEEGSTLIVKVEERKFDISSVTMEQAKRLVYEENSWRYSMNNDAFKYFDAAPRILSWKTNIGKTSTLIIAHTFTLMDYVEGTPLNSVDAEEIKYLYPTEGATVEEKFFLLYKDFFVNTLRPLHDRGIFHGDLNPSNVIVRRDVLGRVVFKLIDFTRRKAFVVEEKTTPSIWEGLSFGAYDHDQKNAIRAMTDIATVLWYNKWNGKGAVTEPRTTDRVNFAKGNLTLEETRRRDGVVLHMVFQEIFYRGIVISDDFIERKNALGKFARSVLEAVYVSHEFEETVKDKDDVILHFLDGKIWEMEERERSNAFLKLHRAMFERSAKGTYSVFRRFGIYPEEQPLWYISFVDFMLLAY